MYYLIDFSVHDEGLFTIIAENKRKEPLLQQLNDTRIVVTDQEFEGYTMLIPRSFASDYGVEYNVPDVQNGRLSIYPLQKNWHNILIGGFWEATCRFIKQYDNCFELRVNVSESIFLTRFVLGEPEEPRSKRV